ncbi:hypothetical protein [Rhizobium sp. PP-F2F-G48]|uniref:hypothetical protein n=1 Tax=Rhizobium sp. PP-F2F-G48 TaxID=2135651 RepID=UPI0010485683|nr:hypothetical protein [Rhizobium sp. PP-F2F-G48]
MTISAGRKPYFAMLDCDDRWSVIDARTGLALVIDGVPMVLLSRDQAAALVEAANLGADFLKLH